MADLLPGPLGIGAIALCTSLALWLRSQRNKHLPPGPPALPLIGSLLSVPKDDPWKAFFHFKQVYGDVVHLRVLGQDLIVLNSTKASTEVMERATCSNRPQMPLINFIGHPEFNFGMMPYGKRWRSNRRLFMEGFSKGKRSLYHDAELRATSKMIYNLLINPTDFEEHFKLMTAQAIIDATYGITVDSVDDPLVKNVQDVMNAVNFAISPLMMIWNPLPYLRFIPTRLFGFDIAKEVGRWRQDAQDMQDVPFNRVKADMAHGVNRPSYTSDRLGLLDSQKEPDPELENMIRSSAAVAFGGGYETTMATILIFLRVIMDHPAIQERAYNDVQRVVGHSRLPNFTDRPHLPFIGVPHALSEDTEYQGFFLPKDSIVMCNIWGVFHDPTIYPDPDVFLPERYLKDDQFARDDIDPRKLVFGVGRRICPGQYFADDTIWLVIARFLAVYTVSSSHGAGSKQPYEFTSGALSHPLHFTADIQPRTEDCRLLAESSRSEL